MPLGLKNRFSINLYKSVVPDDFLKHGFFVFRSAKLNFLPITIDLFTERRDVFVKITEEVSCRNYN